jgi:hypothetical protein
MSAIRSSVEVEDVQPEDVPLPTSSMITVPLSDYLSDREDTPSETPNDSPRDSGHSIPCHPRSISVVSSESSTPSSHDSSSLSPVDWEGLEKTEEQEPKDEGTDDVRCPQRLTANTDNPSLLPSSSLA